MTKFTYVAYEIEYDGCPVGPMFPSRGAAEEWAANQRALGTRHEVVTIQEFGREVERWRESRGLESRLVAE